MSTRCQVKVTELNGDSVTLYHHCDGYPSNMLPLIASAYKPDWEHGRVGKVASFLCEVDPGSFEPESGHAKHGDIEWYYILRITNPNGIHVNSCSVWTIEVYNPDKLVQRVSLVDATEEFGNAIEKKER
jgi:hypothetical protein